MGYSPWGRKELDPIEQMHTHTEMFSKSTQTLDEYFPCSSNGKESACNGDLESACQCRRQETRVRTLGWEDPLVEEMATHSSILA